MVAEANVIIQEACKAVGLLILSGRVSLKGGGKPSCDGTQLAEREGCLAIYEVQQRLDAFLYEARRREGSYELPEYSASTPLRTYDAFDRFDHPMVYERSKAVPWNSVEQWECLQRGVAFEDIEFSVQIIDADDDCEAPEQPHQSEEIEQSHCSSESDQDSYSNSSLESCPHEVSDDSLEGAQDECSNDALLFLFTNECEGLYLSLNKVVSDEVTTGKPTLGTLIIMSRIILARTHNVLCLALTSYLQMAACGSDYGPSLDRLYSLTVGPPARQYQRPLKLTHEGLDSVRRLQLWGKAERKVASRGHLGTCPLPPFFNQNLHQAHRSFNLWSVRQLCPLSNAWNALECALGEYLR